MMDNSGSQSLYERIVFHRYYLLALTAIFFIILLGCFMSFPVVAYDTDLWYHLSGGRFFWKHLTISSSSFFSFVDPPKDWYNYYWLFQVIVFKTHAWMDYYGLIVLRGVLFCLTVLLIALFFVDFAASRKSLLIAVAFLVAYALSLTIRELLIRPHLFSYLFIVVFLYILERKRKMIWLLPILGILWSNIHGIEYPVMILILLAYLMERYYCDFRKVTTCPAGGKKEKWLIILTIYTIFFTPHIIELIKTPFSAAMYQHLYVNELVKISIQDIFQFAVLPFSGLIGTFQNILIIAPIIAIIICLCKKQCRISHVILLIASVALLIKHKRFVYEYILLTIPLVSYGMNLIGNSTKQQNQKIQRILYPSALLLILVIVPALTYGSHFKNRPEYPLTQIDLPVGVTTFLNAFANGGKVMNEPNSGGYLQWALNEKFKIFMDMQLSVFNDQDFAFVNSALQNKETFHNFIRKYDPSFVSVSIKRQKFNDFINEFPQYQPVFYDDAEILYVNVKHYPKIADKYEIKHLNVYEYKAIEYEKETKDRLSLLLNEALRINDIYPNGGINNIIIANILITNAQYEEALVYADRIIERYPNISKGYALKGDALRALERVEQAIEYYEKAISKGIMEGEGRVYWNLHTCYGHLKQYKKAYQAISKFINPFDPEANYRDVFALGISAAVAGKKRDAINFLKIAQLKLPAGDTEYDKKIKENLLILDPKGNNLSLN